jgi:DNA helicase-2/ATP-dependent DNA helicase PcrA
MRRRVFGEELAAEPSQFLNEMPLELIEDLSYGQSWLSFARSSTTRSNKYAAAALRGDKRPEKPKGLYTGKTYNSADAIADFFSKRGIDSQPSRTGTNTTDSEKTEKEQGLTGFDKLKAASSGRSGAQKPDARPTGVVPGSHVRHEKYGKGLVLRREGSGDNVKLTVSFPGFGQKKLIEKYAKLDLV